MWGGGGGGGGGGQLWSPVAKVITIYLDIMRYPFT